MKLLYPTSLALDIELFKGYAVTYHPYDVKEKIPDHLIDAVIMITWLNTKENLEDAASRMHNIQWIQALMAGPNDIVAAGFSTAVTITTGSGLHNEPVAEHTLALMLEGARRTFEMRDFQTQYKWPGHLTGGMQPYHPKTSFVSLKQSRILIWGFGNIGRCLGRDLVALGASVKGVARTAGVREGIEVIDEHSLESELEKTDCLVMILPGNDNTKDALNRARLARLPKHAWVVNVGRGSTVDEDALVDALNAAELGGAALDVFKTEPLLPSSRLWDARNLILSPHAAGGRPQKPEALIAENLRRFMAGQTLQNVI